MRKITHRYKASDGSSPPCNCRCHSLYGLVDLHCCVLTNSTCNESRTLQVQMQEVSQQYRQPITGWQRPIGCLIFIGHFLQKNNIISGSFAEKDLQFEASNAFSPPCNGVATPYKERQSRWRLRVVSVSLKYKRRSFLQ